VASGSELRVKMYDEWRTFQEFISQDTGNYRWYDDLLYAGPFVQKSPLGIICTHPFDSTLDPFDSPLTRLILEPFPFVFLRPVSSCLTLSNISEM
jgi:hypothetical protein